MLSSTFKTFLMLAVMVMSGALSAKNNHLACSKNSDSESSIRGEDHLPWPWGSECPVTWASVEGLWAANDSAGKTYFEIKILSTTEEGVRLVEVNHLDENYKLMAAGRGFAAERARILRAALTPTKQSGRSQSYLAIIRNYVEELSSKSSCSKDRQVTVLTLRPIDNAADKDIHYILQKVEL